MLIYAFILTFMLGATFGALTLAFLCIRHWDKEDKKMMPVEPKPPVAENPILVYPSQR